MSDWQPIETAPKDGTRVRLGWMPNGVLEYEANSYWDDVWDEWPVPGRPGHFTDATHWKPDAPALRPLSRN